MRILFVLDARSPIALNWLAYWAASGHQVFVVSTFAADEPPGVDGFRIVSAALSGIKRQQKPSSAPRRGGMSDARLIKARSALRHWLGPLTLSPSARVLRNLVRAWKPDLVHALRIPYEGMLAAEALRGLDTPLLLSVWGNDFTLHAPASPLMGWMTRRALQRADALHADCQRDVRLAARWGWRAERPAIVLPGNGGLHLDVFHSPDEPPAEPLVINPRGFRAYVRNDTFFQAIPPVLARFPRARFACPAMQGEAAAENWLARLGIAEAVDLLPKLPRPQLADWLRRAQVVVSPSTHDGTPNSLLEAMACGCAPIAGDLDSIREWITPPRNGLLIDPANPSALADAIIYALENAEWRRDVAARNAALIRQRADYNLCMPQAESFYARIAKHAS